MYMSREERKDQIMLAMLTALDIPGGELVWIAGQWRRGAKHSWTVTEVAKEVGLVRSTRLYKMLDELVGEGSLYRSYEPYKSGGITNFRKVYQVQSAAYIQQPLVEVAS